MLKELYYENNFYWSLKNKNCYNYIYIILDVKNFLSLFLIFIKILYEWYGVSLWESKVFI